MRLTQIGDFLGMGLKHRRQKVFESGGLTPFFPSPSPSGRKASFRRKYGPAWGRMAVALTVCEISSVKE